MKTDALVFFAGASLDDAREYPLGADKRRPYTGVARP